MIRLIQGFEQFRNEVFLSSHTLLRKFAASQRPNAEFIKYAEPRGASDMVFSAQPDERFVFRAEHRSDHERRRLAQTSAARARRRARLGKLDACRVHPGPSGRARSSRGIHRRPLGALRTPLHLGPCSRRRIACLLTFGLASEAFGETREPLFTGPLVTPNASAFPAGMINIQPYLMFSDTRASYDAHGDRRADHPRSRQWLLIVPTTIGLGHRWNVQLTAGTAYNMAGRQRSDGPRLTDTSAMLQYMFIAPRGDGGGPAVSLAYTHVFPTGPYRNLDSNPLNGTGSGAWMQRLSIFAQQLFWLPNGHPLRLRAQVLWGPSPSRIRLDGASTYGTTAGFNGSTRVGALTGATVAFEYGLNQHWAIAADLIWEYQSGTRLEGTQCASATTCFPLAGTQPTRWNYSISPAVEYNFNASVGLIVGVQISFAGHNSTADWVPQAALSVAF